MPENKKVYPVIDLHCDMPHYLATVDGATPDNTGGIGCAIPYMSQGKVMLQVMAISSVEEVPDVGLSNSQVDWYKKMLTDYKDCFIAAATPDEARSVWEAGKFAIMPSIENASSFCGADQPLEVGFEMLERIIAEIGKPLYISLTHHPENRFGGGNTTDIGLKDDGRALLDYISGKKIAVDFSHTSDALAHDIINHIDARNLDLPIMASHSNFRNVFDHRRNLPDELAKAVIDRKGLIGMNFLRAFMHPEDPGYLARHIEYGLKLGGTDVISLGADYFHTDTHPDPSRRPFYFEEHAHAGKYQDVLSSLAEDFGEEIVENISSSNVLRFMTSHQ